VSLLGKATDFLNERTGYKKLLAHALDEPVKGGARWAYVFGSTLLATFTIQVVTGVALMTSYSPGDKSAWASVHYLQFQQAGGWLVRGIHHHGAQMMVILLGVHMAQVALFGAYKRPREVTWWFGLLLLATTLGFALTGYLLPWDQKGYWATRVATNIAGTIPVVGDAQQKLLVGGPEYGNLTLTRFYALHVFVLPAMLAGLAGAHVALFRKHGVTPSVKADPKKVDPFYPRQLGRDLFAAVVVVALIVVFSVIDHGAPLDAPADPASDYPARPEWYFLALFQLLKYFHGPMEIVGTVVLPLVVGIFLFALPLIDRKPSTALRGRIGPLVPLVLLALGYVGLTVQASRDDAKDAAFQKQRVVADARAKKAIELAKVGVPPEGPLAMMRKDPELRAPELFGKHCASCHTFGDLGSEKDRTAPKLDGWGTEKWAMDMLHEPDGDAKFGRTSLKGGMPSMDVKAADATADWKPMSKEDMEAAAAFLASFGDDTHRDGPPSPKVVAGQKVVKGSRCTTCHLFEGNGDLNGTTEAPELSRWGSGDWLKAQIANPSSKATYREQALDPKRKGHMPRLDTDLSAEDIDLLAKWLLREGRKAR